MNNDKEELSDEEELASAHSMLSRCLDNWVHLVVRKASNKNYSNTAEVLEKVSRSCQNLIESNIQYYSNLADTVSKEGYGEEAERYRLVAKVYGAIMKQD